MLCYYYEELAEVFPIIREESNLKETCSIYNSPSVSAHRCVKVYAVAQLTS